MLMLGDRVALHGLNRVAPLETWIIKKSFLVIASALCGVGLCQALLGDLWARVPFCSTQTYVFSHLVTVETDKTEYFDTQTCTQTQTKPSTWKGNLPCGQNSRLAVWSSAGTASKHVMYTPVLWVCFSLELKKCFFFFFFFFLAYRYRQHAHTHTHTHTHTHMCTQSWQANIKSPHTFLMMSSSFKSERSEALIVTWAGVNVCSATPLCVGIFALVMGLVASGTLRNTPTTQSQALNKSYNKSKTVK
jgi:hypothetical protein